MSGGILFSNGVFWGKAGWAYRTALDGVCEALGSWPEGKALSEELADEASVARTVQFIDLKDWPTEKRLLLCRAVHECYRTNRQNGPVQWHDPSFLPGFL
jgi:hypothetical protein